MKNLHKQLNEIVGGKGFVGTVICTSKISTDSESRGYSLIIYIPYTTNPKKYFQLMAFYKTNTAFDKQRMIEFTPSQFDRSERDAFL